jgi:hypothetical protein
LKISFFSDVSNDLKNLITVEDPAGGPDVDETGLAQIQDPDTSVIGLSREKRKTDRLTAYACEDSRLNIR